MALDIVILAAGQGTRMRSDKPKVLHNVAAKSMLEHVMTSAAHLNPDRMIVVYGHGGEIVRSAVGDSVLRDDADPIPLEWVEQSEQLGTGHAVAQALDAISTDGHTLVLYGDVPLIQASTLSSLQNSLCSESPLALLTVEMTEPKGYGRIIRDDNQAVIGIVEEKDASNAEKKIREINTGFMVIDNRALRSWIPRLKCDNAQQEYYLTDLVAMAVADGYGVKAIQAPTEWEVEGVNNRSQLAQAERRYQSLQADKYLEQGLSIRDPSRFDIRGELSFGKDSLVDINVIFEGVVSLGDGVSVGANSIIINSQIGDNTVIKANSIIENATIANDCEIGPYARVRPGTEMAEGAKLGNFVETKKSVIGRGSKVNHLSYIGDSEIGESVNVGAGTITCNYDGVNKHKTVIEDEAFIGSNSSLVAPVTIGQGATVGAGSTISKSVPEGQLSLTRAKQTTLKAWKRPTKN